MNKLWIIGGGLVSALVLVIISLSFGLFNAWTFFGIIFYILVYVAMYIYLRKTYLDRLAEQENERMQKRKFDYCWARANEILRNMASGQGLEWDRGKNRRSEFQTFYDGVQHREFRSMEGNLSDTQERVVIIYDIDKDDIVRIDASPSTEVLKNHFYKFNPFRSSAGGMYGGYGSPYGYGGIPRSKRKGVSIHIGDDDDVNDFDEMRKQPPQDAVNKAVEALNNDR